jgi:ferritin-like metal-binding protein YciE
MPAKVKDLVMGAGGKGFMLVARLQLDTPGKLLAHSISYEALELAAYELLLRVAEHAGEAGAALRSQNVRA